jgi:hypothetical protein
MRKIKRRPVSESGAALIIAIFSLMLISVVATALILTAGTQSAIKSNYKSAMHAFYDAKAGLEEARGRLWANNPDSTDVRTCVFGLVPGQACYIVNGADVDPRVQDTANPYADLEFKDEWGIPPPAGSTLIASTSPTANLAGPLYKWVRITPLTEASAKIHVDGDASKQYGTTPLFFDGKNMNSSASGSLVFTLTSLAVTPSGSRRMVQYTVAPPALNSALAAFPSALTLDGKGVSFTAPNTKAGDSDDSDGSDFRINGNDMDAPKGVSSGVSAIGFTNSSDSTNVSSNAMPASNYLSPSTVTPVGTVSVSALLQTPAGLEALVQSITQNADLVLTPTSGPADQKSFPSAMSASNPMVIVVNGDFNLHGYVTGYGILVVTGKLDYDPDASWKGIILVVGRGSFNSTMRGTGELDGAVFIANTRDAAGNLLSSLGPASFKQTGGGSGIHYSSKWVGASQALIPYQILSFREIAQTTP